MKTKVLCDDCSIDCFNDSRDYYMLNNDIWKIIHPQHTGMLCMHCCEKRLGRKLVKSDLVLFPINELNPYTFSILQGKDK